MVPYGATRKDRGCCYGHDKIGAREGKWRKARSRQAGQAQIRRELDARAGRRGGK